MDLVLRLVVVVAVIAAATAFGRWWRSRSGRIREGRGGFDARVLRGLGLEPDGAEALALLLGSPTCAPCVTVKRILAEVADERDRFRWVYADAADHLAIAEEHHVLRVPTLFVLDPDGRVLARTSGVPSKLDLLRVLDREGDLDPSVA